MAKMWSVPYYLLPIICYRFRAMRIFKTGLIITAFFAQIAVADDGILIGDWRGLDHASESIHSIIHIGEKRISWGGGNPYNPSCNTTYTLVENYSSATYPGNTFQEIPGQRFDIYKLKLAPHGCSNEGYFQFAVLTDPGAGKKPKGIVAYVVTYGKDEHQDGWHVFSKEGSYPPKRDPK